MEPAKKFPSVSLDSCANIGQRMSDGKCKGMNGGLWVWPGFGRGWAGQGRAGAKAQERCNVGPFTGPVHSSMHVLTTHASEVIPTRT